MNLYAPINSLGYGQVGANIAYFLEKDFSGNFLLPISRQINISQKDYRFNLINNMCDFSRFQPKGNCLKIWHEFDMYESVGRGSLVALPFFELATLSQRQIDSIKHVDHVISPSSWGRDVILHSIPTASVSVIEMGVDRSIFYDTADSSKSKYIFFTCGKWEKRKGHDLLIDAFKLAFEDSDNVELWLMCDNPFLSKEETAFWHAQCDDSKIRILPRVETQVEVANIMRSASCGVFPSRGEGWNMELLEMMSCGKPVICSAYSAHLQYANTKNAHFLSVKDLEAAFDNKWFFGQGEWACLDLDELIEKLRYMYTNNVRRNPEGVKTSQALSWSKTVEKIHDKLG